MKPTSYLVLSFVAFFCGAIFAIDYDPALIVTIMVKNEQDVLLTTLQPFYDGGVKAFVVFDTGSTDDTIQVAYDFFEQNPDIDGHVFEAPFIDFAASRNHALELTRQQFPNGGYIIMPDAEWYIENTQGLLAFCQQELTNGSHARSYLIRLLFGNIDFYQPRLISLHSDAHFEGEIHETMYTQYFVPDDIYFVVAPSHQGYEKSKKRWERDREILLNKHFKNPWDARTLFYLAQTYDCLQDWPNAYKYYALRTQIKSWQAEDFMAHYRLAQVLEYHMDDWSRAMHHYLEAFSICPDRAEPLIKISQHYWSTGNIAASYLFAQYAAQMPYPHNNHLFIDKELLEFTSQEMVGITGWHVGMSGTTDWHKQQFENGKVAAQKAYEQRPYLEYLKRNVECYE